MFDHRSIEEILRTKDFGRLFGFLRARGWSVAAIAAATGLTETRIRAVCSGKQHIVSYLVIERIGQGLDIERGLLGLAYTSTEVPASEKSAHTSTASGPGQGTSGGLAGEGSAPPAIHARGTATQEEVLIMQIADESAHHGRRAGHSNIADQHLEKMEASLERVSIELLTGPPLLLVRELRQIRDEAFAALEGRQYPRQSRRLYAIAARACGLLAGAAADRFALYDAANHHARTSALAADFAEEPALTAWTASLQSGIACWQGHYHSAVSFAQQGRQAAPAGPETARLASLEARAWARLGDRQAMNAALTVAAAATEQEGPQAGLGVVAFPRSNQLRISATALLWTGEYSRARVQLTEAIGALTIDYASPPHLAAAYVDLAEAHLRMERLDDAAEAMASLPRGTGTYLAGAARRAAHLITDLRAPHYETSEIARQLVADIEAFIAAQKVNGDAAEVGAGSNRGLPQ